MTAPRGSWRAPERGSLARSGSIYNSSGPTRYGLGPGGYYRPGEKRLQPEDGRSVASKYSCVTGSSRNPIGNPKRQYQTICNIPYTTPEDFYKPGTIIYADLWEESFANGSVMTNDKSIIRTPNEPDSYKKRRPFIVLVSHAQSYISLPVFSHRGNGLIHKPNAEEYVSLRDHRSTTDVPRQSSHDPLVTLEMSGPEITPASATYFTYPISRKKSVPVTVVGRLTVRSTNHLIRLFKKYMPVELSEDSPPYNNIVSIHAGMSISNTLVELDLHEHAHLFVNTSWPKAAGLSESDLEAKGITSLTHRKKMLSLLDQIRKASSSGPNWNAKINKDTLAVLSQVSSAKCHNAPQTPPR